MKITFIYTNKYIYIDTFVLYFCYLFMTVALGRLSRHNALSQKAVQSMLRPWNQSREREENTALTT